MQSKLWSFLESCLNTASGFFLSYCVWLFIVVPIYGFHDSAATALEITIIFTVASIARTYAWRRFFEWRERKKINAGKRNL